MVLPCDVINTEVGTMKSHYEDLTGQRFGRLEAVGVVDIPTRKTYWYCKCDCGNVKKVRADSLKCGAIRSCGCLKKEQESLNLKDNKTHGKSQTRLYKIWQGIKKRCYNKNDKRFHRYGGRGITVCDEWKNDFITFQEWALNNGYADNLSIDRIDNNGNYEPNNCKWSTNKEQANNTGECIKITIGNTTKTITEWSEVFNVDSKVILARYHRNPNRTIDELFAPVNCQFRGKRE